MREAGCGMRKGRRRSRGRRNASRIPHLPSRRLIAPTRCSSAARRRAPTRPIPARSWRRTDGGSPRWVMGIARPEELPLLGYVSLVAPAIAVGNTVVAIPSEAHPLAATELYSVLETSDVPAGVINIVTGSKDELSTVLADHLDVDAMWYFGNQAAAAEVERASAGNMKRTRAAWHTRDWLRARQEAGAEVLREATQVKNIWIPYGE